MCTNSCLELDFEVEGVKLMKEESIKIIKKWCRKCDTNTEASVVLRKKDAYCKKCFMASVNHKFRACLGKSKMVRPGEKVLIGFSGSSNSVALLHLVKTGLQDSSHKKLMFLPHIIHIDETDVLNLNTEEVDRISIELNDILKQIDFPSHRVPITIATESDEVLEKFLANDENTFVNNETLQKLLGTLNSLTSKIDMLNKLRYNLLVRTANHLGCSKVFMAQSADDLAIKLLTNISLGRSTQLPYDVGFSDDRVSEVTVIRPLRDISKKELAFYITFNKLTCIYIPSLSTKSDVHGSIQKLTESFLCELQEGFPSTLSTVFRVADKLTAAPSTQDVCLLCKTQKDSDEAASSSSNATRFSKLVASLGPANFYSSAIAESLSSHERNDQSESRVITSGSSEESTNNEFSDLLCYGCSLIIKDADCSSLPPDFLKFLYTSKQRQKMKNEIEDYLL